MGLFDTQSHAGLPLYGSLGYYHDRGTFRLLRHFLLYSSLSGGMAGQFVRVFEIGAYPEFSRKGTINGIIPTEFSRKA